MLRYKDIGCILGISAQINLEHHSRNITLRILAPVNNVCRHKSISLLEANLRNVQDHIRITNQWIFLALAKFLQLDGYCLFLRMSCIGTYIDFFSVFVGGFIRCLGIVSPGHIHIEGFCITLQIKANANRRRRFESICRNRFVVIFLTCSIICISFKRGIAIDFLLI